MGLPEYYAMCRQWKRHPPAHWLVAAQLGYEPPEDETPEGNTRESMISWFEELSGQPWQG